MILSQADHELIADAIRAAEARTSGEIFAVLARESDGYRFIALMWAALAALAGGFVAVLLTPGITGLALAGGQAVAFGLVALLGLSPRLRMLLVPRFVQESRCGRNATAQFLAHNIHATAGRTGVLLFISLAEHFAMIVADKAINDRVGSDVWQAIVDRLTAAAADGRLVEGIVEAVEAIGARLAEHFPGERDDVNELPDHLVEI